MLPPVMLMLPPALSPAVLFFSAFIVTAALPALVVLTAPVSVKLPVSVATSTVPVEVTVARLMALASIRLMPPPVTVRAPPKSLAALARITALEPASMFDVPVTVRAPVCPTDPLEVEESAPVTVVTPEPMVRPAEVVVRLPLVPSTVRTPAAVRSVAPVVRCAVRVLVSLMLVAPPVTVKAPPKSLAELVRVTALEPAAMFDVPVTVRELV